MSTQAEKGRVFRGLHALGAFLRAAREMKEHGTFTFADEAVAYREINELFSPMI
jgi:hypothetical protein